MDDFDFASWFTHEYGKCFDELRDEDYLVNETQQQKLIDLIGWFLKLTKETGGRIDGATIVPRIETGSVTATFPLIDVSGKSVQDFCAVLSEASAITIEAVEDGVCISVNIPNVFYRKP